MKGSFSHEGYTVVGIGEALWDLLPEGKQLGGAPANFAYHASALGNNGIIVSCVGNDAHGDEILSRLKETGLEASYILRDADYPTGTVTVQLEPDGTPRFSIHEEVAWDHIVYSRKIEDIATQADAVCFGTLAQRSNPSGDTIRRFIDATKPTCLRVYDINFRSPFVHKEKVKALLNKADVLKLNEDELPVLLKMCSISASGEQALHRLLQSYYLRLIALTHGSGGSMVLTRDEVFYHEGYTVEVRDTVGAGDAFTATLVWGMLRDYPLDTINTLANRVASFVCTRDGAMPSYPASLREEIDRIINSI